MDPRNAETHLFFTTVLDTVIVYSDQTGHFSVTSSRGVKYVLFLYSYYANIIFQIPSRAEQECKSYRLTQNVMTNSRRGFSSQKYNGWIMNHSMP